MARKESESFFCTEQNVFYSLKIQAIKNAAPEKIITEHWIFGRFGLKSATGMEFSGASGLYKASNTVTTYVNISIDPMQALQALESTIPKQLTPRTLRSTIAQLENIVFDHFNNATVRQEALRIFQEHCDLVTIPATPRLILSFYNNLGEYDICVQRSQEILAALKNYKPSNLYEGKLDKLYQQMLFVFLDIAKKDECVAFLIELAKQKALLNNLVFFFKEWNTRFAMQSAQLDVLHICRDTLETAIQQTIQQNDNTIFQHLLTCQDKLNELSKALQNNTMNEITASLGQLLGFQHTYSKYSEDLKKLCNTSPNHIADNLQSIHNSAIFKSSTAYYLSLTRYYMLTGQPALAKAVCEAALAHFHYDIPRAWNRKVLLLRLGRYALHSVQDQQSQTENPTPDTLRELLHGYQQVIRVMDKIEFTDKEEVRDIVALFPLAQQQQNQILQKLTAIAEKERIEFNRTTDTTEQTSTVPGIRKIIMPSINNPLAITTLERLILSAGGAHIPSPPQKAAEINKEKKKPYSNKKIEEEDEGEKEDEKEEEKTTEPSQPTTCSLVSPTALVKELHKINLYLVGAQPPQYSTAEEEWYHEPSRSKSIAIFTRRINATKNMVNETYPEPYQTVFNQLLDNTLCNVKTFFHPKRRHTPLSPLYARPFFPEKKRGNIWDNFLKYGCTPFKSNHYLAWQRSKLQKKSAKKTEEEKKENKQTEQPGVSYPPRTFIGRTIHKVFTKRLPIADQLMQPLFSLFIRRGGKRFGARNYQAATKILKQSFNKVRKQITKQPHYLTALYLAEQKMLRQIGRLQLSGIPFSEWISALSNKRSKTIRATHVWEYFLNPLVQLKIDLSQRIADSEQKTSPSSQSNILRTVNRLNATPQNNDGDENINQTGKIKSGPQTFYRDDNQTQPSRTPLLTANQKEAPVTPRK